MTTKPPSTIAPCTSIPPRIAEKIKDSVESNRLTIVIGPTGSGKSTLIPSLLLDATPHHRVLCSQPRRLAVVAIAQRVAQLRNTELGGTEVGFHIGNHNRSLHNTTRLLFTTAGILLEELRANGMDVLKSFPYIIIDECHERSPESDLVLALLKEFMRANPKQKNHLILMSATFDHERYKHYFANVPGCDIVNTITLETGESFARFHNLVQTYYLDDLKPPVMPHEFWIQHSDFIQQMQQAPDEDLRYDPRSLSPHLLALVRALVEYLDRTEKDDEDDRTTTPFLIFAPTYRHLEQLYESVAWVNGKETSLAVLHSAVDIEDCVRILYQHKTTASPEKQHRAHRRRILLASAIADSSITIPGVGIVIDLCRSLQVKWNVQQRQHVPKCVWASRSVLEQRKGRTGRTCPGKVFRLITKRFFVTQLPMFDIPQLSISSCHNEALAILCAKHGKNPLEFLSSSKALLDPPPRHHVEDAMEYLYEIGACTSPANNNGRDPPQPTQYGTMIAAMPLNVSEARVAMEGARLGLLHETLVLMAISNYKPAPISHMFGDPDQNEALLQMYYNPAKPNDATAAALASLSCYMFWDAHWNRNYAQNKLMEFDEISHIGLGRADRLWHWDESMDEEHTQWCKQYHINPTSVRSVTETVENVLNVLFQSKCEPDFLRATDPTPLWKREQDWTGLPFEGKQMFLRVYGPERSHFLCKALTILYESRSGVRALSDAEAFHGNMLQSVAYTPCLRVKDAPLACVHFLMGCCKYGKSCRNSHSRNAKRPRCKYNIMGSCLKGDDCVFSHEDEEDTDMDIDFVPKNAILVESSGSSLTPLVPMIESLQLPMGPLEWFKTNADHLFLLGEGDFSFAKCLASLGAPPRFASTNNKNGGSPMKNLPSTPIFYDVDATRLHLNMVVKGAIQSYNVSTFAWNYPFVTGADDDPVAQEQLVLQTFQSLMLLLHGINLATPGSKSPVLHLALLLQGDQFSRWNVLRSCWRTGWRLHGWCPFPHSQFPSYVPSRHDGNPFPVERARFYLFRLEANTLADGDP